jgi:EAL domain-containing protein (putative c-di-GMP-specific phosphodiesterase class I)
MVHVGGPVCRCRSVDTVMFGSNVRDLVSSGAITTVYQPIVDLDSGRVVAYEALARGPRGTRFESPELLFAAAAVEGLTAQLDWACRAAALRGALDAGLGRATKLFINVEPASLGAPVPAELIELTRLASAALDVVLEVTERALLDDPAALVTAIRAARTSGMAIALDDVGADPASLALLPFVEPDVIKLDMRLVRDHTDATIASIIGAVRADAERRNATILAEGIESDLHVERALVSGALLGQGWLYGRPGPLLPQPHRQRRGDIISHSAVLQPVPVTPWDLVADDPRRRTTTKRLLMPMSNHIEQRGLSGDPCVVISAFQNATHFTADTRRRYEHLATRSSMVGAIGEGMPDIPGLGVRGGTLPNDHPLVGEWTVTVVGPHDAAALIARDRGEPRPDADRSFEYVITHDRPTVIAAARCLMQHITPLRCRIPT